MNTKPKMLDIINITFSLIKAEWKLVAYSMNYTPYDVKAFENDSKDLTGSCIKLFEDWLTSEKGITPKTWQKLIHHIKIVDGLQHAAEIIEERVKKLNV